MDGRKKEHGWKKKEDAVMEGRRWMEKKEDRGKKMDRKKGDRK